MIKVLFLFAAALFLHVEAFGAWYDKKPQEYLIDRPLSDDWVNSTFPYTYYYVCHVGKLHLSDTWAQSQNEGLFAAHKIHDEFFFYGKITGDAVGTETSGLGAENVERFKQTVINFFPITFSQKWDLIYLNFKIMPLSGTCTHPDGREGNWHFIALEEYKEELQMLLVVSFERDSLELLNEVYSILEN